MRTYNQQKNRLQHTVKIDETWISLFKPLEKDQAKQWKISDEKLKQVAVADRYGKKYMMILALYINGICYYEILDQNETINSRRYLTFLENLMDNWHGSKKHTVWLLDDNAKPHRNHQVSDWLEAKEIRQWAHPPYSPDLSPCDYGCFRQLKRKFAGKQFKDLPELKEALDSEILRGNQ